ncbi:MAG: 4'-phosphopantetheinyl transferase superfamily protein [Deltaproteobacteria bacterium]|nr:4'-phosphopantetheinyl transferase superfamily protein [Deltaproteobacteria bacterium]
MLIQIAGPQILSEACFEYSARLDVAAFDPMRTPHELGVKLPPVLMRAVPLRKAEFVAGRYAALMALKAAGCQDSGELRTLEDRSPHWPPGFVGTITHTSGYVSAAVAAATHLRGLGRDTERILDEATALEIQGHALRPEEIKRQAASGLAVGEYTGVIFSAKESLYKALAPLVRRYFDFQDAQVLLVSKESGKLRLRLESDLGAGFRTGFEIDARFLITEHIHTAVELV